MARACHRLGIPLIHISTNEVFDGTRAGQPYDEWDQTNALSAYARSKLAGEKAVRFYHDHVLIVRIAWLFAPGGNNFPGKICAAADKHGALQVVDDEFGNPTYAPDLGSGPLRPARPPGAPRHLPHHQRRRCAAATNSPAKCCARPGAGHIPVTPIPHTEWPRPSQPPLRALLANRAAAALGIQLRPWQEAVAAWAGQTQYLS